MSSSVSSRRTPSKSQLQERSVVSPEKGGGRWRYNGTGQFVETPSEWELVNEMGKMNLDTTGGDVHVPIHTPPQSKANTAAMVHLHETSPLETGSEDSLDSNSPHPLDQSLNLPAHSRGSSADTTGSSHGAALSSNSQTLRAYTPLKVGAVGESRNRPHSYSGGLSSTDLVRLQQAGGSPNGKGEAWSPPNGTPERQADPLTYPSISLTGTSPHQDSQQPPRSAAPGSRVDEYQSDYNPAASQYNLSQGQPLPSAGPAPGYVVGRPNGVAANMPYRQPVRPFNPQVQVPPVIQSPTNFAYPAPIHPVQMINNTQQQLYDMMLPTAPIDNATLARLQQQHNANVYRGNHQHSASDPASLRDPATLALINNNMQAQAFAARQMYPPAMGPPATALSMFPNQFYGAPQEAFSSPDLAAVQMMLQTQYTGPYGVSVNGQNVNVPSPTPQQIAVLNQMNSNSNGPSANNRKLGLYKTELCRSWEEKGTCRYGAKCQFAHGEEELRKVTRHPKYKTEICRTFWVSGSCPYGKRCCFIHTELPASGAAPGADGAPPPPTSQEGRARSPSTNSDPNEGPGSSLLARISKRSQEGTLNSGSGSVSTTPPSTGYQVNGRPGPGALRVDTSVLDAGVASKQNKSAYPTFAHNGILLPAAEEVTARSPGPVTAGPDFGRHASARIDIVGSQQQRGGKNAGNANVRHSFNGSDIQLDFSATTPTATNSQAQFGLSSSPEAPKTPSRINGHVRSGSAGNWGSATSSSARTNHLTAYPLSSIPGGELKHTSPWADYAMNNNRIAEQNWA